jgi:hypothetical protein
VARAAGRGRSVAARWRSWYRQELELAAGTVPRAHQAFLEVWNLLAPASRLYRPDVAVRVLAHAARRRRSEAAGSRRPSSTGRAAVETSGALRLATASDVSSEIRLP